MIDATRNVLVIGGAGYIGSVLTRRLLQKNYRVTVLDNLIYDNGAALSALNEHKNYTFNYGSMGDDEVLKKSMEGVTDVVLLACLVGDPISKKYPALAVKTNVEWSKKVFNLLADTGFTGNFIFTSTCSNYGLREDDTPATEDAPLNPKSLYAENKVEFEQFILSNLSGISFCPTILRLSTAFGISPRMRFDLTVSEFTRELALNRELLVYDENTWRPYCHVEDISGAIIRVLQSKREDVFGEVFNIGSNDQNHTKKMIVDNIKRYLPESKVRYKTGGFDPRNYRVSFDKMENRLGFKPEYTIDQSIRALIHAIQNHLFDDVEMRKNFYGNYEIPGAK